MSDRVVFPLISALNWPSHVLQVWLTLHELGVPDENIRFIPELAHFSQPEVNLEDVTEDPQHLHDDADQLSLRHPLSPSFDQANQRLTVSYVDPTQIRPRLKVSVRSDTRLYFGYDAQGNEVGPFEQVVGRLAHFLDPLLADLPPAPGADANPLPPTNEEECEKPLLRLTRQVCDQYPELVATLPPAVRDALDGVAEAMQKALEEPAPLLRTTAIRDAAIKIDVAQDISLCRTAFLDLCSRLSLLDEDLEELRERDSQRDPKQGSKTRVQQVKLPEDVRRGALIQFRRFADTLFNPHPQQRQDETLRLIGTLDAEMRLLQTVLWRKLRRSLAYENQHERKRIVLEMLEILTTQAFNAVAACDMMWGIGWAHGNLSDFRLDTSAIKYDGTLFSVTGGLQHRALMQSLLRRWAEQHSILGVGRASAGQDTDSAGRERLDMGVFDEAELNELWALCVWRRDTPDPILLLELALQRFIHPEARVRMRGYADAHSAYGTLLAQPGATAVLGGTALLRYPGAVLLIPLAEDADDEAIRAKKKLQILKRLFLPVCFRCEVVWQEAVARLDSPVYLQHDFQVGVRLVDPWAALHPNEDEVPDPPIMG